MISAKTAWNKVQHEAALIGPAIREGLHIMNQHKPLLAFLALTTVFGAVANHNAPLEVLGDGLSVAGWAALPYCWGRAMIARAGGGRTPSP